MSHISTYDFTPPVQDFFSLKNRSYSSFLMCLCLRLVHSTQ